MAISETSQRAGLMSRRRALAALTATSTLALMPWPRRASAEITGNAFLELSRQLTGKSDLGERMADRMLAAFDSAGRGQDVAALIDGADAHDLANDIVAAWYSGLSPDPDSSRVLSYRDALMWRALDYTKPMAVCGGAMGYWADPPST